MTFRNLLVLLSMLGFIAFTSCETNNEPEPIDYGKDQCHYCKMTISDPSFGAELITEKGRVLKYDATECLVNHINEDAPVYAKLFAVPYDKPNSLKNVNDLVFVISENFRSPMGANLAAFSDSLAVEDQYQPLDWNELVLELQ